MGWTEKDKHLNDQDVWAFERSEEWCEYREANEPKDYIGIDCWFRPLKYSSGFFLLTTGLKSDGDAIANGILLSATNRLITIKPINRILPIQYRLVEEMGDTWGYKLRITSNMENVNLSEQEVNLAVAAIAGWEDIELWNKDPKSTIVKKTFVGTNEAHRELGKFIPEYVTDLSAIVSVFRQLRLLWSLTQYENYSSAVLVDSTAIDGFGSSIKSEDAPTPALALCKLLLAIAPTLIPNQEVPCV